MNQVTIQKRTEIANVQAALEKMKPSLAAALPKHITPERMMRVALTAVQNTPKLLECDRNSLFMAIIRASQLGLEPDGILGQAYLIPYGKTVQLIPGYRGLIDLARRSGEVSNIIAKEVCENDKFTVNWANEIPFVHEPIMTGDRGKIVFFWAMARFKDGGFHFDYMSVDEVIAIRNGSSGYQQAVKYNKQAESPWEKHFVEMGKKTAIRRIAKYLPMSVQRLSAVNDLVDAGKPFSVDEMGEVMIHDGEVIDGEVIVQDAAPTKTETVKAAIKAKQGAAAETETVTADGEIITTPAAQEAAQDAPDDAPATSTLSNDEIDARLAAEERGDAYEGQ